MKKRTFWSFILLLILLIISSITQCDAQTFISRTKADGVVGVDLSHFKDVKVLETKGSHIRFELTVSLKCEKNESSIGTPKAQRLARLLAEGGRYQYKMIEKKGRLIVSLPKTATPLKSKTLGDIEETFSVRVFVPKGVTITL